MEKRKKLYRFRCRNCEEKTKSISHEFLSERTYYYEIYCVCDKCQFEQIVYIDKNVPRKPPIPMNGVWSKHSPPKPHETSDPKTTPK